MRHILKRRNMISIQMHMIDLPTPQLRLPLTLIHIPPVFWNLRNIAMNAHDVISMHSIFEYVIKFERNSNRCHWRESIEKSHFTALSAQTDIERSKNSDRFFVPTRHLNRILEYPSNECA